MLTDAARRTGFVKRASKITGKIFLALVTFGALSDAKTTFAQLAAKVTPLDEHVDVSPEAIYQRMHKRAHAFLQEMIQQALAKTHAIEQGCEDVFCAAFTNRLIVARVPEAIVNERRRKARKNAQKKGYTPSYAHQRRHHFMLSLWSHVAHCTQLCPLPPDTCAPLDAEKA